MATFQIEAVWNQADLEKFQIYLDSMTRRAARTEIVPILLAHLQPMVSSEKSYLSSHSKSGALEGSLMARSGSGDRAGTVSVFSVPTATTKQLQATWAHGRKQQRKWAAGVVGKRGRTKVFYGIFVHQGHKIVVHGSPAKSGKTHTSPVPFAKQAAETMGDTETEAAASEILKHIIGA